MRSKALDADDAEEADLERGEAPKQAGGKAEEAEEETCQEVVQANGVGRRHDGRFRDGDDSDDDWASQAQGTDETETAQVAPYRQHCPCASCNHCSGSFGTRPSRLCGAHIERQSSLSTG